ncbi:85/88 kDa calcium-independent phospholipase A2-like [Hyalella azteca]|uniref:phospholipase A2 n=1 Tax=Hyalella azteca TaxID=294128 RepID=A0A8B7NB28_HYAAZ|nr:85/88 kDa calcium-independent phospholipase A2-like [Hyalella azteca]
MNFVGNFVKSFLTTEVAPEAVVEVNIAAFANIQVLAREEGLFLYGPTKDDKYELILQQPIETNARTAISLFRLTNRQSAQERFIRLRELLRPLLFSGRQQGVYNVRCMQELMTLHREHPTWQAAHIAAQLGDAELMQCASVAQYCNVAELDLQETPLHIAVRGQKVAVIKALMQMGVSTDAVDVKGNSVYHLAASTNKQIIELIMQMPRSILMDAPNNAGKTPLHIACQADKPDCVTALLSAGVDVNVAATQDSCLAIHTAMAADSDTCAREILERHPNMLHVQDMKLGGTPLHWAKSKRMITALVELKCHVNAKNFDGRTALHLMTAHDRLGCVVALLSHGARPDIADKEGNTPLHLAKSVAVLHALIVFGAPLNCMNSLKETARHVIANSTFRGKAEMLYALHAVGAARCLQHHDSCCSGCSPVGSYNGVPPEAIADARERLRSPYDAFLDDAMCGLDDPDASMEDVDARLLCLDGGGIRGLVLIVLLRALQRHALGAPIKRLFDWIAGTSTGAILALALSLDKSPDYALGLYFRLKDQVFQGTRPYPEGPLEDVLKRELGETTVMSDITGVKVVVTGVLADRYPADLHLFRNYDSGEQLLRTHRPLMSPDNVVATSPSGVGPRSFVATQPPSQQLVWEAARASGAAPSYFRAYGRFIDGGLIANNPSLDLLTEISERNAVVRALGRPQEITRPSVLVSLGTGRPPLEAVNAIDCFRPESLYGTLQMAFGLSNMAKLLIDQATMADNHTVDRCRAWCQTSNVRYVRLSPLLSADVQLDETRDEVLLNMLWEAEAFCVSKKDKLHKLAKLLTKSSDI